MQRTVYIALGSNAGDPGRNLERALEKLSAERIEIVNRSSVYRTAPRDFLEQPWFLNMVVECRTADAPVRLIRKLMRMERELGRDRVGSAKGGPRVIDLDILLIDDLVIDQPRLTVPHPRMLERRFMLEPLFEIAPHLRHPITGALLSDALPGVQDQELYKIEKDQPLHD